MQNNVSELSAQGGGDGPESVACALYEALNMDYRKDSARVVVIISDAPPHGLGESGDGFPNGNYHPLVKAHYSKGVPVDMIQSKLLRRWPKTRSSFILLL